MNEIFNGTASVSAEIVIDILTKNVFTIPFDSFFIAE